MRIPKSCKILRLEEQGWHGIISFVDNLLDNTTYGDRRIASKVKDKFKIPISREAIRSYRNFRRNIKENIEKKPNIEENFFYYKIAPIH
jgi:hypothetical protein